MSPDVTHLLAWPLLGMILVAIAIEDLRTQRIPNILNLLLLVSGFAVAAITSRPTLASSGAGSVLGGTVLLAVAFGFHRLRGLDGLGLGDVKFLAAAGAWVGWQGVGPLIFIAAATALVTEGGRRLGGAPLDSRRRIPFGPALCVALVIVRCLQWRFDVWT